MSEHPELREALVEALWGNVAFIRYVSDANAAALLADALLAGPVGKLQAELADAQQKLRELHEWIVWMEDECCDIREWDWKVEASRAALAAGESAVTGEAT